MRPIEKRLSQLLRASKLEFIGIDPIESKDIIISVKNQFPDSCDDNYLCPHCPGQITKPPEWHHIIRSYLTFLKSKGLAQHLNRGEWTILPPD